MLSVGLIQIKQYKNYAQHQQWLWNKNIFLLLSVPPVVTKENITLDFANLSIYQLIAANFTKFKEILQS